MGVIISPALLPFVFGFLVARAKLVIPFPASGCVLLMTLVTSAGDGHMESGLCTACWLACLSSFSGVRRKSVRTHDGTLTTSNTNRMYERGVRNAPSRPKRSLRYRIETLVGITGVKMAKYRATWFEAVSAPFKLIWRPHLLSVLIFEVLHFHDTGTVLAVDGVISCTGTCVRFWHWHQRTLTTTS